jgi:NTE family protein
MQKCADIRAYFIELSFAQHPDPAERAYLSALPTSFRLSREQVDRVRAAARLLLDQSSEYHRLLTDLPL